jgi:hypothetical protein
LTKEKQKIFVFAKTIPSVARSKASCTIFSLSLSSALVAVINIEEFYQKEKQ